VNTSPEKVVIPVSETIDGIVVEVIVDVPEFPAELQPASIKIPIAQTAAAAILIDFIIFTPRIFNSSLVYLKSDGKL
jgi:hypothetical protein